MSSADVKKLEDEISYWKSFAEQQTLKLENAQEEFGEFQQGSRELEKELETQIEQLERKNRDLSATNQKLFTENESYRARLQLVQLENVDQSNRLETEFEKVKNERDELQRYIRDLEQSNDDLERAKRAAVVSLEEFERRLNEAIERNAFLENELDEKDNLQTYVQRLKEEARDLRQELKVKDRIQPAAVSTTHIDVCPASTAASRPRSLPLSAAVSSGAFSNGSVRNPAEFVGTAPVADKVTSPPLLISKVAKNSTERSTPSNNVSFTASSRISALNIVSDLLRKVGALETKLASSKRFSVDHSRAVTPTTPIQTATKSLVKTGSKWN